MKRKTKIRSIILKILSGSRKPLSVPEIIQKLKEKALHPNKSTIYRFIDSCIKNNKIKSIKLEDGIIHYELQDESNHHHHLICRKCKKTEDINSVSLEEKMGIFEREVSAFKHFINIDHSLEFYGLCRECQK